MALWQKALPKATHELPLSGCVKTWIAERNITIGAKDMYQAAVNTAKLTPMEFQIGVHRGSA